MWLHASDSLEAVLNVHKLLQAVCVCDVKTHGRHWRVYLNDIAISLQFNVSFLKPTCTAVSAEELSAAIYLRMTTLNSILFFHMLSKRVFA